MDNAIVPAPTSKATSLTKDIVISTVTNIIAAWILGFFGLGLVLVMSFLLLSLSLSAVFFVLCWKKKIVLKGTICETVAGFEVKYKKLKEDFPATWMGDERYLLGIADSLSNVGNKVFNGKLCKKISDGRSWIEVCEELKTCWFVFDGKGFWEKFSDWCTAGIDVAAPKVDIDIRGEKVEDGYEVKNRMKLADIIVKHFKDWYVRRRGGKRRLVVRFIGANDVKLAKAVLSGFRFPDSSQSVIHVYVAGVMDCNLHELEHEFNQAEPSCINIHDGTVPINEDYDVVICTHYWQHHFANHLNKDKSRLNPGGLLIWLAATSRSSERDEYVCEGCLPMLASILSTKKDAMASSIPYTVMGEYVNGYRYITYTNIPAYRPHIPVLTWGFPKTIAIPLADYESDSRLKTFLLEYFNWGKETEASSFLKESRRGMANEVPNVEILGIDILRRIRKNESDHGYVLLVLKYQISGERKSNEMPIIAIQGREKNEWTISLEGNETSLALHPALHLDPVNVRRIKTTDSMTIGVFEEIIRAAGLGGACERYKDYIPKDIANDCAKDVGGGVWRIHTKIKEIDLNDFIVFAMDAQSGVDIYYSYLPTRRYLTEEEFELGLRRLDRFDIWKKSLAANCRFASVPRRTDSYTWLWSYRHFLNFCKKHDLSVVNPDVDVYFHKGFGILTDSAKKAFPNVPLIVSSEHLEKDICCVDKDREFNELPLDVRLKLLGCMNIHDMLLFAEKK